MDKKVSFEAEIIKHEQRKLASGDKGARLLVEYLATHKLIQKIDSLFETETLVKITIERGN